MGDKIINRLFQYLDNKGIPHTRFEKEIGLSNGYLNTQLKRNADLGESVIRKVVDNSLELNPLWLLTGEGDMITVPVKKTVNLENKGYPLIPVSAFAGFGGNNGYSISADFIEDRYVVPLFDGKGVDFLIQVRGSSMYPKYSSGDIVACRFIKEILYIQWNKVYVLDTRSQGAMLKRLKKSTNPDCVVCKSDNKEYDDFEVPLSDILNLALVIGVIRLE